MREGGIAIAHHVGTWSIIMRRLTRVSRSVMVLSAPAPLGGAWECGLYSGVHSVRERSFITAEVQSACELQALAPALEIIRDAKKYFCRVLQGKVAAGWKKGRTVQC